MNKLNKILSLIILSSLTLTSCKKEDSKTNESKNSTEEVAVMDENAKMETANLSIEGMTCEIGCAKTIEDKLAHLDGVKEAKVDFEGKLATVSFDANKQNLESLKNTVEAVAGGDTYTVTDSKIITK
ncbi:heavy-metal-associated domain-containing protein [Flavobacterium haoranii]|uniref:Copper chaperone CopZ n=1 Tax=Flavobacterium haoranii TaxID=683124 RepID=A0A1M6E4D6_9FLAO|nr:heavy metal-associated domain-containing protein [Flavobacterium haoranii]SHI80240.1 Copper chaperone CopZ [Flavobacterium haoranii]